MDNDVMDSDAGTADVKDPWAEQIKALPLKQAVSDLGKMVGGGTPKTTESLGQLGAGQPYMNRNQ